MTAKRREHYRGVLLALGGRVEGDAQSLEEQARAGLGGETGGGSEEAGVKTDIGVTGEPCPGGNAERDCIYLGVLSDLTEGPFRALAVPITEGQKAFWKRVNDQGGIAGRQVNFIVYDDGYTPPRTLEQTRRLVEQDKVAFLFNQLGTPTNSAIHRYVNARKIPHLFLATGADKWAQPKEYP